MHSRALRTCWVVWATSFRRSGRARSPRSMRAFRVCRCDGVRVNTLFPPSGLWEAMSDGALIEAFLEMLSAERGARANTLDAYARDLEDARGEVRGGLRNANADAIERYVAGMAKRGLSPATARRRISALRQFYRFLLSDNVRSEDPTSRLDAPRRARSLPKTLSLEEIERLIAATQSPRDKALIELMYGAGLR